MKSDRFYRQDTKPDLQEKQLKATLPAKIGPYKIESLLSKGGMSLLYLGLHPETNAPLVIKVLLPKYVKNKEVTSLFLKEAEIIKMTNHPNIIQLYGEGEWEKGLYIAMEFIQGVSLRQFIQHKSLNLKRALEIVLQVAYALCHLHVHGVIHRDLKPENILITETGQVKVIDFGIALLKGEEGKEEKKRLMGTPVYMSPEQKTNPNKWSQNSDIYALGVITYELVLGRLSHGAIHLSLLPKRLASLIDRALKMEYQDVVEFITEVSQYIKTLDEGEKPETLIANNLLLPKGKPKWPPIDLGIAIFETDPFNGLYLDFFSLTDNRYCMVLAEPRGTTVPQVQSLDLRGMIRMGVKKEKHLPTMMQTINQILLDDHMEFALSMLMLYPDKDRLSFISCGFSDLWHIPEGSRKIRSLTTPNPRLGKERNGAFLEVEDNWQFGDTLVFHSTTLKPTGDYEFLSLQHSAESILQKAKTQTTAAVLTISRK